MQDIIRAVLHPELQRLKVFWLSWLQQNQGSNSMKRHSEQGVREPGEGEDVLSLPWGSA